MKRLGKRQLLAGLTALVMIILTTGTAFASGSGGSQATTNYTVSANEARNGVVRVLSLYEAKAYYTSTTDNINYYIDSYAGTYSDGSTGSAFGVGTAGEETDVFVTNRHVVTAEDGLATIDGTVYYLCDYTFTYYILLDDYAYNSASFTIDTSRAVPCSVIYVGEDDATNTRDVAILRAAEPVSGRVALALQDSEDSLEVGDSVTALGYPSLSDSATSEGYLLASVDGVTLTNGVVSRFFETTSVTTSDDGALCGRLIQSTASINGGNSGGPLVDENGTVVGINTYTYYGSSQSVTNAYYALRIKYAKEALDSLDIYYEVYKPGSNAAGTVIVVVVILAAVAAVAAVLVLKKKQPVPQTESAPIPPQPVPEAQPVVANDSGLRFQGMSGVFSGQRFAIGNSVKIGRDPAKCDLVYPTGTQGVSGVHCALIFADGQLYLKDLGSTYGTYLGGGQRLAANEPVMLNVGDQFYLGSERERFVITRRGGV